MIDITNTKYISPEARKDIFMRSLYTQPYFYRMDFPLVVSTEKTPLFADRVGINGDFYLTETTANFGEVFEATGALFNVTLFTGQNRSLYRWEAGSRLPSSFMLQEARFRTIVINQIFDDRQFEYPPLLIRSNDKVYAEIANTSNIGEISEAIIVLKGFRLNDDSYLSDSETKQINKSLASEVQWQYFKLIVEDVNGRATLVLENDNFPRLILGLGAVNSDPSKTNISLAEVQIQDLSRRLSLTDRPIPLEFLAPRLTCEQDTHLYYLPTEYYMQPFARIEFDITNIPPGEEDAGFELAVLTRTV